MLIRGTEPGTFIRLVYHNTKPLTVNRPVATFRFGGLLWAVGITWAFSLWLNIDVIWFPLGVVYALLVFLLGDVLIGTWNTLLELKVLDSIGDHHDHSSEAGDEEGEQGEEGEGSSIGG